MKRIANQSAAVLLLLATSQEVVGLHLDAEMGKQTAHPSKKANKSEDDLTASFFNFMELPEETPKLA